MLVSTVLCFVLMFNRRSKIPKGQTSQESLTRNEKIYTWIICLLDPILGGAILYYGWKNRLPIKAKKANQISLWAFFLELVIGIVILILIGGE